MKVRRTELSFPTEPILNGNNLSFCGLEIKPNTLIRLFLQYNSHIFNKNLDKIVDKAIKDNKLKTINKQIYFVERDETDTPEYY